MNEKKVKLIIKNQQSIEIVNLNPEENHICMYDELAISFVSDNKCHVLYRDVILGDLRIFRDVLKYVVDNQLNTDESIELDLGFHWNEYLHDLSTDEKTNKKDLSRYLLWSSGPEKAYSTWFYNKDNEIILEISPDYPWHFIEPKEEEAFDSYDEWMKNYKPLFLGQVDKATAQKWIRQIDEILIQMDKDELRHKETE